MRNFFTLFTIFTIMFFSCAATFAQAARNAKNDTDIFVDAQYYDSAQPGDAVFVKLSFQKSKRNKTEINTKASLALYRNEKQICTANFYPISTENTNHNEKKYMLASIPLSTYLSADDSYKLKVTYALFDANTTKQMELPFSIKAKDFIEETIPLNETNTAIRTDTSKERMDQINRLNKIFATTDGDGVHTFKPFIAPVDANTRRSSFFGDRRTYVYSTGKRATSLHYGTDYAVPTGTKVICPADGKIVMAENRISTGWSIVIEHLPGLYSIYYHMSKLDVKTGQKVAQGDLLGASGATGMVTGPHLHWEIRLLGEAVSPDFFTTSYIKE